MQIAQETGEAPRADGVELVALLAQKAIETYDAVREGRTVAAALHLAC